MDHMGCHLCQDMWGEVLVFVVVVVVGVALLGRVVVSVLFDLMMMWSREIRVIG